MAKKRRKRRQDDVKKFTIPGLDELTVFEDPGTGDLRAVPAFVFANAGGVIRVVNTLTGNNIGISSDPIDGKSDEIKAGKAKNVKIASGAKRGFYPTKLTKIMKGARKKKRSRRLRAGSDPEIIITGP